MTAGEMDSLLLTAAAARQHTHRMQGTNAPISPRPHAQAVLAGCYDHKGRSSPPPPAAPRASYIRRGTTGRRC